MNKIIAVWLTIGVVVSWLVTQPLLAPVQAHADDSAMTQAVATGVQEAEELGITQYVYVLDRSSGEPIAWTDNAGTEVASESLVKLYLAAYQLRAADGDPTQVPCDVEAMISSSDDDAASACWSEDAVARVSAEYDLENSSNDPYDPQWWGSTHVTAADVATLTWELINDPLVSPTVAPAMLAATDWSTLGEDQNWGFNAIEGAGSKQGWGPDSYWLGPWAIHTVGFTDDVVAAVLQTASWDVDETELQQAATRTAQLIADVELPPSGSAASSTGLGHRRWLALQADQIFDICPVRPPHRH